MIKTAASEAMALSIEAGYTTKDNIQRLLAKAYNTAKNFALKQNASRAAISIAESAKLDVGKEKVEEKKEEVKPVTEEKPKTETAAIPERKEAIVEVKKEEATVTVTKDKPQQQETKKEEPAVTTAQPEIKKEVVAEIKKEEKAEVKKEIIAEKKDVVSSSEPKTTETKKEEKKSDMSELNVPKRAQKPKVSNMADAEKISQDFKEEIAAEKKRREDIDQQKTEELANQLKKKGTLRE